jgi:hypothetical protein
MHNLQGIKEQQHKLCALSGQPEPPPGNTPIPIPFRQMRSKAPRPNDLPGFENPQNQRYETVNQITSSYPRSPAPASSTFNPLFRLLWEPVFDYRWGHREWDRRVLPLPLSHTPMTRKELLRIVILRARVHGFEFRPWFQSNLEPEWPGFDQALALLSSGRRYYALLFSHDFASHFWKKGTQITFLLPSQEYTRLDANGKVVTIKRKSFTRRSSRSTSNTVWQYHLEQMAVWDEPLRYIRRFIITEEELEAAGEQPSAPRVESIESVESKEPQALPRRADWC